MVTINTQLPTVKKIFLNYELQKQLPRKHLGGSEIGTSCERKLWYGFRHCGSPSFDGRMLRLFETGQLEETRLIRNLRMSGIEVLDIDPDTKKQFTVEECGGHFGGSLDGVGRGFPESTKWHLLEFKTANNKSFKNLEKYGVNKSKPIYWAQMQVYMHLADLERAYFLCVNKDTDEIYGERIKRNLEEGKELVEKARKIIFAQYPPFGVSDDPKWFECKFCSFSDVCYKKEYPEASCRNCLHTTPEPDGTWSCAVNQKTGKVCKRHLFIPDLLGNPIDADEGKVIYESGLVNEAGGIIK